IIAGQIDAVELGPAIFALYVTEEENDPAIRRPGRAFIVITFGEDPLARSVRADHADRKSAAHAFCKRDEIAARRPDRRRIATLAEGDPAGAPARSAHDIKLLASLAVGFEHDPAAVRRVARRRIDGGALREPHRLAAPHVHLENIGIAAL